MSDIEILEMQLKKIKDFCKDNDNKNYYPEELPYYMFWNGKQAEIVENLIKENNQLKKQMDKDLDVIYLKGVYDERDKWKNKVKEKIKYIEENYSEHSEFSIGKSIEFLQELLEEGR